MGKIGFAAGHGRRRPSLALSLPRSNSRRVDVAEFPGDQDAEKQRDRKANPQRQRLDHLLIT